MKINPFRWFSAQKFSVKEFIQNYTADQLERAEEEIYDNAIRKIKFRQIINRKLSFYA